MTHVLIVEGVEELDAESSAEINGGEEKWYVWLGKQIVENWNEIEEGFKSAYDPCTR